MKYRKFQMPRDDLLVPGIFINDLDKLVAHTWVQFAATNLGDYPAQDAAKMADEMMAEFRSRFIQDAQLSPPKEAE